MDVREALASDIEPIVELIEIRRHQLEEWEPRFWKKSADSAEMSRGFLGALISDPNVILLVAQNQTGVVSCLQYKPTFVPPVYEPGGKTWMVDDFCVREGMWETAGRSLLDELKRKTIGSEEGQLVFPVPEKDAEAEAFFKANGLSPTTVWWTLGS